MDWRAQAYYIITRALYYLFAIVLLSVAILGLIALVRSLLVKESESLSNEEVLEKSLDFIEREGVITFLSEISNSLMDKNPEGFWLDQYTFIYKVESVGSNIFYYYEVEPSLVDGYYPGRLTSNAVLENCTQPLGRMLVDNGAKVHHYYWVLGNPEKYASVVVGKDQCEHYTVEGIPEGSSNVLGLDSLDLEFLWNTKVPLRLSDP